MDGIHIYMYIPNVIRYSKTQINIYIYMFTHEALKARMENEDDCHILNDLDLENKPELKECE